MNIKMGYYKVIVIFNGDMTYIVKGQDVKL